MGVILETASWDDPVGVRLRREQESEAVECCGADPARDPGPPAADVDLFLLARDAETAVAVGCAGLRRLDETTYEVERVYVTSAWRGRRIGEVLLRALEEAAVRRGATRMRLETGSGRPASVRLYERCGYHRIERFGHYADRERSVCFERTLTASAA
ncbi:GNAT family N-acetyltransferase [Actinorugispora endophytica]|uniref:Acetyltransferase (GNAT) family protein n=1 Tax=Actinorugispora endophytica TaxID=1605990 RepID=A0A4R6UGZ4_9ACTN|nr:GNAT family N-acetyltransferase [Actinorugispora endophytica]TDQ46111.1 acetyltransferase (GNAT) family protein [Actinorugispora endophytica]